MCFIADKGNTAGYIRTITKIDSDYHDPFMNRPAEKCYKFFRCEEHTRDNRSAIRFAETIKKRAVSL